MPAIYRGDLQQWLIQRTLIRPVPHDQRCSANDYFFNQGAGNWDASQEAITFEGIAIDHLQSGYFCPLEDS